MTEQNPDTNPGAIPNGNPPAWHENEIAYAAATAYTYPGAAPVIAGLARCFVKVDQHDRKRMGLALALMRRLDNLLDENTRHEPGLDTPPAAAARLLTYRAFTDSLLSPEAAPPQNGQNWIPRSTWGAVRFWGDSLQDLSEEVQSRVVQAVRVVGDLSVKKAAESNIERYKELLIEEGKLLAPWVLGCLGYHDTPNHRRLNDWGERVGIAGVLFFAAIGLNSDRREGRSLVQPSWGNHLRLLAGIPRHIGPMTVGLLRGGAAKVVSPPRKR